MASNPVKAPLSTKSTVDTTVKLSADGLRSLKHDVEVLKKVSDLRKTDKAKTKHGVMESSTAERKAARRQLSRLAKKELRADQAQLEAAQKKEQEERRAMMVKPADHGQPCLLAVCQFLRNEFVHRLPSETCQVCGEKAFPSDPEKAKKILGNPKAKRHPLRVYCGHWFHRMCLHSWMTQPPFGKCCSADGCGKRLYHPLWTSNIAKLEKDWAAKEAKKREMADVVDCFDVGDEFRVDDACSKGKGKGRAKGSSGTDESSLIADLF